MALRTLVLNKRIREKRERLTQLEATREELRSRETQLESDIEAAQTDEERAAVDEAIETFDREQNENNEQISAIEGEIADLERELEQAESSQSRAADQQQEHRENGADHQRRENDMPIQNMNTRAARRTLTRETLIHPEVRTFYENLTTMIQTRAQNGSLSSAELVIPEIVMDRIEDRMGDYATVANEVETLNVGGTSRVILDGADPEAVWVEQSGAISQIEGGFAKVEFDGWKLAGYMAIPNDIIEDSLINLAVYVETKLAKAIAKSRDKAILKGTGSTGKQLVGIIPSLKTANSVTVTGFNLGEILSKISLVDDGEEAYGEIIAVMKRSTFYGRFLRNMITTDSAGRYVVPDLKNPNIGVRVVFSQYMDADKVLFGDFRRYMVTKRAALKLAASTDVKFIEDQTVIKGLERLDGKPLHVDGTNKTKDWVLVTIKDAEDAAG